MVVCIVDLELFVALIGSLNLYFRKNILSGLVVILVSALIALLNYLIFLKGGRFKEITERFQFLREHRLKRRRMVALWLTILIAGSVAIGVSVLNSQMLN